MTKFQSNRLKIKKIIRKKFDKIRKTIDKCMFFGTITVSKEEKKYEMSYEELLKKYNEQSIELENVKLELNNLKKIVFGSKREKMPETEQNVDSKQCSIFDSERDIEENIQEQIAEQVEEITVYRKKKSKKRTAGIKKGFLQNIIIKRQE